MKTATTPSGFHYGGKLIFFVEAKGKDISFPRWRMDLYYTPHSAETVFFATEAAYDAFLAESRNYTFSDYSEYRAACEKVA